MKIEHITFLGSSAIRDTDSISPEVINHFKAFQTNSIKAPIQKTNFICKLSVENEIAIFDFYYNGIPLCINVCCFNESDKEATLLYAKDLVTRIYKEPAVVSAPKESMFFITILFPIPIIPVAEITKAGEIEFYVYDAIRRYLSKES